VLARAARHRRSGFLVMDAADGRDEGGDGARYRGSARLVAHLAAT
jgi:hypothetical protein